MTIKPSLLAVTASSNAIWICSAAATASSPASTSENDANANPFLTGSNAARSFERRSRRGSRSKDSPFKSSKSKAMTMTAGPASAAPVASFFLVDSRWNGSNAPVAVSTATTSASKTKDVVASFAAVRKTSATSGHFFVVSWRFLEKTRTSPPGSRWAWNRSPSYLCSHV